MSFNNFSLKDLVEIMRYDCNETKWENINKVNLDASSKVSRDPSSEVTRDPSSKVTQDPSSEVTWDPSSEVTRVASSVQTGLLLLLQGVFGGTSTHGARLHTKGITTQHD